jgi:hypothetical protein
MDIGELDITASLRDRPSRAPDYQAEAEALHELAGELERGEGDMLGKLADIALRICRAQSSGISVLEPDGSRQVFRWHAVRGTWAHFEGHGLPREASPCGITVARRSTFFMKQPGLVFPEVAKATPAIAEVLLAPFDILGETLGTVWVIAHDESVRFDAEDARIVERLARFAGKAFLLQEQASHAVEMRDEMYRANRRLTKIVEGVQAAREDAVAGEPGGA